MARFSSHQITALYAIVEGKNVPGYLLDRTVPSLINRGFVAQEKQSISGPSFPYPPRQTPFGPQHSTDTWRWVYKLTPAGHDEYVRMRTKRYETKRAELKQEFESDLRRAKARMV